MIVLAVVALVGAGTLVAMLRSTPPATDTQTAGPASGGIGTPFQFRRADTGEVIGTITIRDTILVPTECVIDPVSGTEGLAIQVEIDNIGTVGLGSPDMYTATTVHSAGVTQSTENGTLTGACAERWPGGTPANVGLRTMQWILLQVRANPVALQYTPIVADEGATLENLELVTTVPGSVKIPLPATVPTVNQSPTSITVAVAPSTPAVVPMTQAPAQTKIASSPAAGMACDPGVDNWAVDASGGQLKCTYAGAPTPKWVNSAPLIGTRQPGSPCSYEDGIAESPSGQTLMCTGDRDSAVWIPGP
ncbi:hypothetical protein ACFVVM_19315 [Nocardia sp. NPDC058176]|uniref:hypothetical protein n=1 Tax=Nocardia sp. NPDC058176 TaxID=3346368 RepID=UPI0036DF0C63